MNGSRWTHVKRGSTYVVLHEAYLQASTHPGLDEKPVVVYQSEETGSVWVRARDEFLDGRFERLS